MSKMGKIGYGKPPVSTRFQQGRSGNPRGRPKKQPAPPHEAVLGKTMNIRIDGEERRVTLEEAFLLSEIKRGLKGDAAAAYSILATIDEARAARTAANGGYPLKTVRIIVSPESVNSALEALRVATKRNRYRPSARMQLEPRLVEDALARFGDRRLSCEEQAKVVQAVRKPHKVRWPEWWEIMP